MYIYIYIEIFVDTELVQNPYRHKEKTAQNMLLITRKIMKVKCWLVETKSFCVHKKQMKPSYTMPVVPVCLRNLCKAFLVPINECLFATCRITL